MRRKVGIWGVLVIGSVGVFCPCAWGKYGGGSGTASDPFLIYTGEHLRAIAENPADWGYYVSWKLMADIDLAAATLPMKPIGRADARFTGIFDGNGKTISNLTITASSGDYVALFGYVEAEIHDLALTNVKIDAPKSTYVGALAGWAARQIDRCHVIGGTVFGMDQVGGLIGYSCSSVSQCHATCTVAGNNSVGGLVGWNVEHQTVSACYATGAVSGVQRVGGLAGTNRGILRDCYATGNAHGDMFVGGLVGTGEGRGPVWNCYATGRPTCEVAWVGGLAGFTELCFSSFWDAETSGVASSPYGVARTAAQMHTAATFLGWGRDTAWTIAEGTDYPRLAWEKKPGKPLTTPAFPDNKGQGTAASPYLIHTAQELSSIGDFPAEWGEHYRLEADIDLAGLDPPCRVMGSEQFYFTGTFDGGGHSIANFQCPTSIYYYGVGLFAYTYGATIKRLTLIDPRVEFGWSLSVGALVGQQCEGTVEACAVQGGAVSGATFVGGLVGRCTGGAITRCSSTCKVTSIESTEDTGGLLGKGERCNVSESYAGGGVHGETYVGGLIGRMDAGSVAHCYSFGPVAGTQDVGGLIGLIDKTFISACFWDTQTSGLSSSAAGTGLHTSEMQKAATYIQAGWDFVGETKNGTANIWCIAEGHGYPQFAQGEPATPHAWADDFEDGDPAPLWQTYEQNPQLVHVAETNGRLELHAQIQATGQAALYVARGWALDGSKDFNLRIDFRLNPCETWGKGWVSIGVAPNPAQPQGYRVEIKAGQQDDGPVYGGVQLDETGVGEWSVARGSDAGTLYISYDAGRDELYRSFTGYGPTNAWNTVTGLLKSRWKGNPVYVFIGGGSTDISVPDGSAWLDNFVVDTGEVITH